LLAMSRGSGRPLCNLDGKDRAPAFGPKIEASQPPSPRDAKTIRLKSFATAVLDGSRCASSCAFAWLGGSPARWGRLTDDDLDVINGRQDQLEGRIQERYGLAKDQAKQRRMLRLGLAHCRKYPSASCVRGLLVVAHMKRTETRMHWSTPTLVEICIGLEINGYLPAEF
jgi:coenzyme PQQ precursor peptide PqqA